MEFYISKTLQDYTMESAEELVAKKLKEKGFGIVTELDVSSTLKAKIGVDFKPYKILGACSPNHAFEVLSRNDKIGVFLPCNVCIQQNEDKTIEVFAINPVATMQGIDDPGLDLFAQEVSRLLTSVIDNLDSRTN